MTLFLILIFAVGALAQQPDPSQTRPRISTHNGVYTSDNALLIIQGQVVQFTLTWWTTEKNEEMPLEDYRIELKPIEIINGEPREIPWAEGVKFSYHALDRREDRPPREGDGHFIINYYTPFLIQINTTVNTPAGTYLFLIRSKGYWDSIGFIALVVIDNAFPIGISGQLMPPPKVIP
jgi:hypothetical protein